MPTPRPIIDASWVAKSGVGDDVAEQLDEPDADADAEQRDEDRQPHREHRAEREQQDHDRGEEADELGRPEAAELLEHAPAERDLDAGAGGVRRRGADVASIVTVGIFAAVPVELHGGVGDVAVTWRPGGRPSACTGSRRAVTCGTLATSANSASIRASHGGGPARHRRRRTRSGPRRPACAGKRDCSRSVARCDSVPDRWKPCEKVAPTLDPMALHRDAAPRSTGPRPVAGAGSDHAASRCSILCSLAEIGVTCR